MISIHAPREGSDCLFFDPDLATCRFLSTLPARGATFRHHFRERRLPHFYPRSPRGERRPSKRQSRCTADFYPRSPRGERLVFISQALADILISIHAPREGSDIQAIPTLVANIPISIHAPREGSDDSVPLPGGETAYFYPRSPRGERRPGGSYPGLQIRISIHAPREGSDVLRDHLQRGQKDFYPRSPRGERRPSPR